MLGTWKVDHVQLKSILQSWPTKQPSETKPKTKKESTKKETTKKQTTKKESTKKTKK
jgi:hypothetical protein